MKMDWRLPVRMISAVVFAVALGILAWLMYESWENTQLNRILASQRPEVVNAPIGEDGIMDSFRDLLAQNSDTIGWLTIDGTSIDYVVMQSPDEPDKYLHRDFNGSESRWGALFVAEDCDVKTSDNIIIYGHHMRDGSMFGALAEYESAEYCAAHPNVRFDTIYGPGRYEIVAVVRTDVSTFPFYDYTQANDPETFAEYAAFLQENSIYDTGRTLQAGDKILTLSTCNYHTANGRLIVVCRKTA